MTMERHVEFRERTILTEIEYARAHKEQQVIGLTVE